MIVTCASLLHVQWQDRCAFEAVKNRTIDFRSILANKISPSIVKQTVFSEFKNEICSEQKIPAYIYIYIKI